MEAGISKSEEFLSSKLWFDLQAMILGIISLVSTKLKRFPGTTIKRAVLNQDVVENHFCQMQSANDQNENPTYLLTQATQNAVILDKEQSAVNVIQVLRLVTHSQNCQSKTYSLKKKGKRMWWGI